MLSKTSQNDDRPVKGIENTTQVDIFRLKDDTIRPLNHCKNSMGLLDGWLNISGKLPYSIEDDSRILRQAIIIEF